MKALITGIAGFAGSHLAELLLKKGFDICGTVLQGEQLSNIKEIKDKLKLYDCNIIDEEKLNKIIKETNPDRVYHLAAQSSVGKSFHDPKLTYEVNVLGTVNLLEGLRNYGEKDNLRILLVSSAEVYGIVEDKDLPIKEDYPLMPISPYAASKAATELVSYQYYTCYGLNIVCVRPFNHIGPKQSLGFVIPDFAHMIAEIEAGKKKPILKVGNLEVRRDFSDILDVVEGYWLSLEKADKGDVYNICSGKVWAIQEVIDMMLAMSSVNVKVEQYSQKMRPTDSPILCGDSSKFRKATGWQAEICFKRTLKDLLNYWREKV